VHELIASDTSNVALDTLQGRVGLELETVWDGKRIAPPHILRRGGDEITS
jgi:hypothetical protein